MKELMLIQSELKAPKNQFNRFGNYNYRSCEDILEAVSGGGCSCKDRDAKGYPMGSCSATMR